MAFTEHGDYMRIFRITYVQTESPVFRPAILSTRLFLPYNKTNTIIDIKHRLSDWVNQYLGERVWRMREFVCLLVFFLYI